MADVGERELLAIIFTDAVGSSSQTAKDEDKSLSMLMADLDFIRNEAGVRGGSVLKNTGDGLLISFKSAVDAVECALAIQKSFQSRPKDSGFQHKIGVHIGDVIKKDGDIYGAGVNTASRLVDQCAPGGICLSSTLYELTKQKSEIGQLKFKDFLLQNTEPPILAYRIFGENSGKKEKSAGKHGGSKGLQKKSQLILAVVSILLGACVFAVVIQKRNSKDSSYENANLCGFEYKSGLTEGLKSNPNGAPIYWILENNTDLSLELRWYDFDGRPKISDNLNQELSKLGPGRKFSGLTGWGNSFGIFDSDQKMLGSIRFLAGDRLYLVANKDKGEFVVELKNAKKAKEGDAFSQAALSEMYWSGIGAPKNDQEAARYAKLSFKQGNSFGVCMMAAVLDSGTGVSQNSDLALEYWRRASAAGEGWADARLGDRYLYGYGGVSKNLPEALSFLERAALKGNSWAMVNLGKCYENGWGVSVDLGKSKDLYSKALARDHPSVVKEAKERLEGVQKRMAEISANNVAPKDSIGSDRSK